MQWVSVKGGWEVPESEVTIIRSSYFSIVEVVTRFLTTAIKPDQKYIEVGECEVGWEVLELELM